MQRDASVLGGLYNTLSEAAIRVTEDGIITNMNPSAESLFGMQFSPDKQIKLKSITNINLPDFMDGKGYSAKEVTLALVSGASLDANVSITRVKHIGKNEGIEYVVVIRDMTEIKNLRKVLEENSVRFDLLQTALDHSIHPVLISNEDYKIIFANKRVTEDLGYTVDECLNRDMCFLCDTAQYQEAVKLEVVTKLKNNEIWVGSLVVADKYHNTLYISSSVVPADANNKRYYIMILQESVAAK